MECDYCNLYFEDKNFKISIARENIENLNNVFYFCCLDCFKGFIESLENDYAYDLTLRPIK